MNRIEAASQRKTPLIDQMCLVFAHCKEEQQRDLQLKPPAERQNEPELNMEVANGDDGQQTQQDDDTGSVAARSRRLLSSAQTTPQWLLDKFPLGQDTVLIHLQHKDHVLPHFQVRFSNGTKHDGKHLACYKRNDVILLVPIIKKLFQIAVISQDFASGRAVRLPTTAHFRIKTCTTPD